jgi:hypothetical protein
MDINSLIANLVVLGLEYLNQTSTKREKVMSTWFSICSAKTA